MAKSITAKPRRRAPAIWFRTLLPHGSLGPGKIDLLRLVLETGSVSAAARQLNMSHARSVKLVGEINALGPSLLISTRTGGRAGGGASLTDDGRELLDLYDRLDTAVERAAAPHLHALEALLSDPRVAPLSVPVKPS